MKTPRSERFLGRVDFSIATNSKVCPAPEQGRAALLFGLYLQVTLIQYLTLLGAFGVPELRSWGKKPT